MRAYRGISAIAVVAAIVTGFAGSAFAAGRTSVAPPHGGGWKIKPYTYGSAPGSPGIDELTGTFTVSGGGIAKLEGTTQHAVNSGCNPGVTVRMLGRAPIRHYADAASGTEYYWVGTGAGTELWEPVKVIFQAHGTKLTGSGKLRIYFPGGNGGISQGQGIGNLEASNKTIGICNLNFDVR